MTVPAIITGFATAGGVIYTVLQTITQVIGSADFRSIWQSIKDLFSAKPGGQMLDQNKLDEKQKLSLEGMRKHMVEALGKVPNDYQEELAKRAAAIVTDVVENCMAPVDAEVRESSVVSEKKYEQAAERARNLVAGHAAALATLAQSKADMIKVEKIQVENPENPHGPKLDRLVIHHPGKSIENLVMRGGGAKGVCIPPALKALENIGMLPELKRVVGSSDASLTAIGCAFGLSSEEFQRLSESDGLFLMLGTVKDFSTKYSSITLGAGDEQGAVKGVFNFGLVAQKMLETLDRVTARSVDIYLSNNWKSFEKNDAWLKMPEKDQKRLESLKEQKYEGNRAGRMITFSDLRLLHRLAPTKFKELILTGYDARIKQTVYFSADADVNSKDPGHQHGYVDMPIAYAGRISQGSSWFFAPVEICLNGEDYRFRGVSNMPAQAITNGLLGDELKNTKGKTLLMAYEEDGATYSVINGSPSQPSGVGSGFIAKAKSEREQNYATGFPVLPVFHGDLRTHSLIALDNQEEDAKTRSMLKTLKYITKVSGRLHHTQVEDAKAAARVLTEGEQDRFLAIYQNSGDELQISVCNAIEEMRDLPLTAMPTPSSPGDQAESQAAQSQSVQGSSTAAAFTADFIALIKARAEGAQKQLNSQSEPGSTADQIKRMIVWAEWALNPLDKDSLVANSIIGLITQTLATWSEQTQEQPASDAAQITQMFDGLDELLDELLDQNSTAHVDQELTSQLAMLVLPETVVVTAKESIEKLTFPLQVQELRAWLQSWKATASSAAGLDKIVDLGAINAGPAGQLETA